MSSSNILYKFKKMLREKKKRLSYKEHTVDA